MAGNLRAFLTPRPIEAVIPTYRLGVWGCVLLSPPVAVAVAIIVVAVILAEVLFCAFGVMEDGWVGVIASSMVGACMLAVLKWPPLSAIGIVLVGFITVPLTDSLGFLTPGATWVGVVAYTCSAWVRAFYCGSLIIWVILSIAIPPILSTEGIITLFVIGILSGVIGRGARQLVVRNRLLQYTLEVRSLQEENELRAERARIADELHDVIAHDIALVAMHVKVLERADDPQIRNASQQIISRSANRALADTRRVLHLIHGTDHEVPSPDVDVPCLRATLSLLADELRVLGDEVEIFLSDGPPPEESVESILIRMAKESVTNILKHTDSPRRVTISLTSSPKEVVLAIWNSAPNLLPIPTLPSSGYGLASLAESAELAGGTFHSGPVEDGWLATMTLPR